jgi:hypothetical protein
MDPRLTPKEEDPGVPEALSRAVAEFLVRVSPQTVDRIWLFPPLRKGRREHGLVSASCFPEGSPPAGSPPAGIGGGDGADRRVLVTLSYRAEETGKGIQFETRFEEEGEAPADRLPGIMAGVVRRAQTGAGEPVSVQGSGDSLRLSEALGEVGVDWTPPPSPPEEGPGGEDSDERAGRSRPTEQGGPS